MIGHIIYLLTNNKEDNWLSDTLGLVTLLFGCFLVVLLGISLTD
jgi:hypothetical protein